MKNALNLRSLKIQTERNKMYYVNTNGVKLLELLFLTLLKNDKDFLQETNRIKLSQDRK